MGESDLSGAGVLDVAGGAGGIAFELAFRRGIPCVVIDPRPMKLNSRQPRPQESGQQSGRAQHRPAALLVVVALQAAAAAHSGASGTEGGATRHCANFAAWLGHSHCAWRRFQHHDGAPRDGAG